MSNLEKQINASAAELRAAWTSVQTAPTKSSLPAKCYEQWRTRAALHQLLTRTIPILAARDSAWKIVQGVAKAQEVKDKPKTVNYGDIEMEFTVARHLALTSYVSITWSIYDRLANVCGRLSSVGEVGNHPKQNPKLCEDLLGEIEEQGKRKKRDTMGFGGHFHIYAAYAWPIKVSYKIRNWLVHEGYEEGSILLFEGDGIADRFILNIDAVQHLQRACGGANDGNKKGESTCVSENDDYWINRDLLRILEQYNSEIDTMFVGLLKWSVGSFVGQIKAFAARDHE
jgi:hypothetical protein